MKRLPGCIGSSFISVVVRLPWPSSLWLRALLQVEVPAKNTKADEARHSSSSSSSSSNSSEDKQKAKQQPKRPNQKCEPLLKQPAAKPKASATRKRKTHKAPESPVCKPTHPSLSSWEHDTQPDPLQDSEAEAGRHACRT